MSRYRTIPAAALPAPRPVQRTLSERMRAQHEMLGVVLPCHVPEREDEALAFINGAITALAMIEARLTSSRDCHYFKLLQEARANLLQSQRDRARAEDAVRLRAESTMGSAPERPGSARAKLDAALAALTTEPEASQRVEAALARAIRTVAPTPEKRHSFQCNVYSGGACDCF